MDASLASGWSNYGTSAYPGASYWRAPDGLVHWRGMVAGPGGSSPIADIPAGARIDQGPSNQLLYPSVATDQYGRTDLLGTSTVANSGTNTYRSLNGIDYMLEG